MRLDRCRFQGRVSRLGLAAAVLVAVVMTITSGWLVPAGSRAAVSRGHAAATAAWWSASAASGPTIGAVPVPRASGSSASPDTGVAFPLHTNGASVVDASGKAVKFDFVNWYGAESPDYVVGGLEYQPISEIISEIV